jgi:hypothetical protein
MFITWRTYTATAGFSTQLEYVCALCGTRAAASVQAQGMGQSTAVYGAGGGGDQAAQGAEYNARANAIGALQHAPCPRCGGYQPVVTSRFQAFNDRVAKAKKRALPIAGAALAVTLLLGIVPAIRDLKHSSALLVTVVFGALSLASMVYAIARATGARPHVPWGQVHFWWGRPDGSSGWVPPPHVPPPALAPPSSAAGLGVAGSLIGGFATIIALAAWSASYEDVYVVDYQDRAVSIDGVDVTNEASTWSFDDKHVRKFSTRTGQPHTAVIAGVKYPLPETGTRGWVIAPDAKEHDVCFAEYEAVYGHTRIAGKPQWARIEPNASGVIVLSRSYDDLFKDSPKTQEVKSGSTVRRWELRTVSCESLDEDLAEDERKKSQGL